MINVKEPRKSIDSLMAAEAIELLKKSSEELRQTPYTRGGLIMRLVILGSGALTTSDSQTRTQAVEYLKFLLQHGSYEDRAFVGSFG